MISFLRKNRRQAVFLAKLAVCCGAWYVLYDLWLLPDGRLDEGVSRSVAILAGALLNGVGFDAVAAGRTVLAEGVPGVFIADGCNGLATVGLFVGFVLAYPGSLKRRALFLPLGVLAIYLANVGRIVSMVVFQRYWPAGFDIMHTFGMTALFYAVVFGLWMLWARYGGQVSREVQAATARRVRTGKASSSPAPEGS